MSEESLSVIHKFETELRNDGSIEIPKDELKPLYDKGFRNINVVILGSSLSAVNSSGIDNNLFNNIKEMQTLPDSVVLDFLRIKGKLENKNFERKINFE